jgi:hypothetical protein
MNQGKNVPNDNLDLRQPVWIKDLQVRHINCIFIKGSHPDDSFFPTEGAAGTG